MTDNAHKVKVLICAYACNPFKGSEEGVGWGWVKCLAERYELKVFTADIEQALEQDQGWPYPPTFHSVPRRWWHYRPTRCWDVIEGSALKPLMNLAYSGWQTDAAKLGQALHAEHDFDLAHQLTYVGFRFPGELWKLPIPFVCGPIGGLENTPWKFLPMLGIKGAVYYAGRNAINSLQKRFLPGPKQAFQKASGNIIAATEGIRREIQEWYGAESFLAASGLTSFSMDIAILKTLTSATV